MRLFYPRDPIGRGWLDVALVDKRTAPSRGVTGSDLNFAFPVAPEKQKIAHYPAKRPLSRRHAPPARCHGTFPRSGPGEGAGGWPARRPGRCRNGREAIPGHSL